MREFNRYWYKAEQWCLEATISADDKVINIYDTLTGKSVKRVIKNGVFTYSKHKYKIVDKPLSESQIQLSKSIGYLPADYISSNTNKQQMAE